MFKLKRMLAFFCAATVAVTSTITAMAAVKDNYTFSLTSGLEEYDDGYAYVTLSCDGFDGTDAFTPGGQMSYKVTPKGALSSVDTSDLGKKNKEGLYSAAENNPYAANTSADFTIRLNQGVSDEYDLLTIMWGGDCTKYHTETGNFIGVELEFASTPVDLIFTPKTDNSSLEFFAGAADSTGTIVNPAVNLTDATKTTAYKLAAGTCTVTPVEAGGEEEDDNEVEFEGFVGTKEDGVTPDGSVAVATKTSFEGAVGDNTILWTVNLKDGNKATHESTVILEGAASYTLGMVINGLAADLIASIEAVLAQ